jgi:hypothetical protein
MHDNRELLFLVIIALALLIIVPQIWCPGAKKSTNDINNNDRTEKFIVSQKLNVGASSDRFNTDPIPGNDPDFYGQKTVHPIGKTSDYESLIFDNTTGSIMSGSQFMDNTGIVAPPWIAPAWDPDAYGPSSKGEFDPEDYENDPRMLYNKCSISCCSPQYPTPFKGDVDPFTCADDGNSKYLSSDYICQNNTGGTGCLCMTEQQVKGMRTGFVDYYADPERGYE